MDRSPILVGLLCIAVLGSTAAPSRAFEPPGSEEQAAVDKANAVLDKVYNGLMSKAEPEEQKSLKEAQRAWIKWRDAEAMYIARHGGAVGGSALRVDYANAQLKLIKERTETLKEYASQAPAD